MLKFLLSLCLLALSLTSLFAQDQEPLDVKFGRLLPEDLTALPTGRDSAAEAYLLYNREYMTVNWKPDGTPVTVREIHRRVKLLRPTSFERANVEVRYYWKSESISDIKAVVYQPNGVAYDLKKKEILREDIDETRRAYKWTFPQITEGAIIEYTYTEQSEGIVVPTRFYFQEDIPTRYVEYATRIPQIFNYVNIGNAANFDVVISENKTNTYRSQPINDYYNVFGYYDMPAYRPQPYMNNFQDWIPQARYQLRAYQYPNNPYHNVMEDWPATAKTFDERSDFGRAYQAKGNSNAVWKDAEPLLAGLTTDAEKAKVLYDFVIKNIKWTGKFDWTSDNAPDKVYLDKSGDSAEMSMLLLALLRRADIEAGPALVSLRNSGAPIQVYPILSQFNHLMVAAKIDGKEILLDPNDRHRPMGLPRINALNGAVMVLSPENPHWLDIEVPKSVQTVMANLKVEPDGKATADIQSRLQSYFAFTGRSTIDEMENDDEFPLADNILESFPEAKVLEHKIKDEETSQGDIDFTLKMEVPIGEAIDDFMYIRPIIVSALNKELQDTERRLYPVDFNYPWMKRYISTVDLPEGYAVDELPESIRFRSEDGSIQCTFSASQNEAARQVSLNFTVDVSRVVYAAEEYEVLREMFNKIIELQQTDLVLKKTK